MYHRNYTTYLQKELDFLKLLVARFHEQEKVNELELDVALSKTQEIYEQLLRIKVIPEAEADKKKEMSPQAVTPTLVVAEKKENNPEPVTQKAEKVFIPENIVITNEEKISKEKSASDGEEKEQQAITEPAKAGILAEKISPSDFHPINETLAQKMQGNDLSSKLQATPLSTIGAGIGLNDQFLYIRELFKGDNALYYDTLRHLDTAESLDDAMNFIHRNFDWDKKNETTQKFITLIYRRHKKDV